MNTKQYYETVDFVKEKPPSNGMYLARVKGYEFNRLWFSDGGWYYYGSNKLLFDIESWLRPVDLSELIREVAGKAWDAAQKRLKHEYPDVQRSAFEWTLDEKNAPDKETYLRSLINTTNEQ